MKSLEVNLAFHVLEELTKIGIEEFCVCPAARNSAFVNILDNQDNLKPFYFYEERSAAFFALGRARQKKKGVAIITTSGTAVGELLPAVMEAHYTGVPLVLVTADRPRRYRGTGAPQAAEQVGIFGPYVSYAQDLEACELCDLSLWNQSSPLHLNVCLEDPNLKTSHFILPERQENEEQTLDKFLNSISHPFVVVSTLDPQFQNSVLQFLVKLNCPVYLEGVSGLREHPKLQHLRIFQTDRLLQTAEKADYKIDGVLRIGGVPTFRLWRDLESPESGIKVCSISSVPFKGSTCGSLISGDINHLLDVLPKTFDSKPYQEWLNADKNYRKRLNELIKSEPASSQSIIHALSCLFPEKSHVYIGNSLPIREWDLAATATDKQLQVNASRGVNGIDGQISTFYGLCAENSHNFAILGDLTTLYDMPAPWILPQLDIQSTIFVINNGGGKIFSRMFASDIFQNIHDLNFKPLAEMWGLGYERWVHGVGELNLSDGHKNKLIEIIPDNDASNRFHAEVIKM